MIPTAGTTIANEGIALSKHLQPSAIPTRPAYPLFGGTGWRYGDVPPQVD